QLAQHLAVVQPRQLAVRAAALVDLEQLPRQAGADEQLLAGLEQAQHQHLAAVHLAHGAAVQRDAVDAVLAPGGPLRPPPPPAARVAAGAGVPPAGPFDFADEPLVATALAFVSVLAPTASPRRAAAAVSLFSSRRAIVVLARRLVALVPA